MEQLQAITSQLGINQTVFYQFGVVIFMFFVTKYVFYNVLQDVLDLRVQNTTKLDGKADLLIAKAEKIEKEFEGKVNDVNKETMELLNNKKTEITKKFDSEFKAKQEDVNKDVDGKISAVLEEVKASKDKVLSESKSLAESLVNKLV